MEGKEYQRSPVYGWDCWVVLSLDTGEARLVCIVRLDELTQWSYINHNGLNRLTATSGWCQSNWITFTTLKSGIGGQIENAGIFGYSSGIKRVTETFIDSRGCKT